MLAPSLSILVIILGFFQVECRSSNPWSVWHKYSDRNRIFSPPISHQKTAPRTSPSKSKSTSSTLENGRWVIRGGRHVWMPYKWSKPPPPPSISKPATDRRPGKYPQSTYFVYRVDRLSPLQALVSKVKAKLSPLQSIVSSVKAEKGQSGNNAIHETKNSFRAKFVGDWDLSKPRNKLSHERLKPRTSTNKQKGGQTSIGRQRGNEIKWQVNVGKGGMDGKNQVVRTNTAATRKIGRRTSPGKDGQQRNKFPQPILSQGKRTRPLRPSKKNIFKSSRSFSRGGVLVSKGKGVKARRTGFSSKMVRRPSNKIIKRPRPSNKVARQPGYSNDKPWRPRSSNTRSGSGSSSGDSESDSDEEDDR